MIVNLGCGNQPKEGAVNLDAAPAPHVDVVHDLDVAPWPFADDSVAELHAHHVFEHVADPVGFMCESWRVLRPGGLLHIEVPHYESRNAFTDPTHRRYCTEETFWYWVPRTWLYGMSPAYHPDGQAFTEARNVVAAGNLIVDLLKEGAQ